MVETAPYQYVFDIFSLHNILFNGWLTDEWLSNKNINITIIIYYPPGISLNLGHNTTLAGPQSDLVESFTGPVVLPIWHLIGGDFPRQNSKSLCFLVEAARPWLTEAGLGAGVVHELVSLFCRLEISRRLSGEGVVLGGDFFVDFLSFQNSCRGWNIRLCLHY